MTRSAPVGGLVSLVALAVLCACSMQARTTMFNNSGQVLRLDLDPPYAWGRKSVTLSPGDIRTVFNGDLRGDGLTLITGRCAYRYNPPVPTRAYWAEHSGSAPLKVQVEPDLSLALLPRSAKAIAAGGGIRAYGYPVKPISKVCA